MLFFLRQTSQASKQAGRQAGKPEAVRRAAQLNLIRRRRRRRCASCNKHIAPLSASRSPLLAPRPRARRLGVARALATSAAQANYIVALRDSFFPSAYNELRRRNVSTCLPWPAERRLSDKRRPLMMIRNVPSGNHQGALRCS